MTIKEFRNNHCGRGGVPPPPPYNLWGELNRRVTKGYSFVRIVPRKGLIYNC